MATQSPPATGGGSGSGSSAGTVVFFHPDLGIGGAERLVVDAAVGLKQRGHRVVIFTNHCDPSHCFDECRDGRLASLIHPVPPKRGSNGKGRTSWLTLLSSSPRRHPRRPRPRRLARPPDHPLPPVHPVRHPAPPPPPAAHHAPHHGARLAAAPRRCRRPALRRPAPPALRPRPRRPRPLLLPLPRPAARPRPRRLPPQAPLPRPL